MLKEFARVSSDTVIVSLWVDGNFRAWRHQRKQERKLREQGDSAPRDRFLIKQAEIEAEFAAAGPCAILGLGGERHGGEQSAREESFFHVEFLEGLIG